MQNSNTYFQNLTVTQKSVGIISERIDESLYKNLDDVGNKIDQKKCDEFF